MSMLLDRCIMSPCSCPCCMSMLDVLAACLCSCPCWMSLLHAYAHVHVVCCVSLLHVLAVFLCCVSLLYVHAASTCCVSMLYIFPCNCSCPCHTSCSCRKSCPWCMSWKGNGKLEAKCNETLKNWNMWRKEAKYLSFVSFHFGAKRKVGSEMNRK